MGTCFWCKENIISEEKYSFCSKGCMEAWGDEKMSDEWRDYARMMGVKIVE
jgi:hypothetical protein